MLMFMSTDDLAALENDFVGALTRVNFRADMMPNRDRLYFLAGHLDIPGTAINSGKLRVASTGERPVKIGR